MFEIRKVITLVEEIRQVSGLPAKKPLRKVAAAAVITNPFARLGYVEDLSELVAQSNSLGVELGLKAVSALDDEVQSYGKAAISGTAGDQEQAIACITSTFAEPFRAATGGGKAWISSVTKVGAPGTSIDVPMACKDEIWVRSHYDAIEFRIPDAPMSNEIVVIVAVANRGRIHARLGGMTYEEAMKGTDS